MKIDIRNHGAVPAGRAQNIAANTAATQAAVNIALAAGEGDEIYIPHNTSFDPSQIDYGPSSAPLNFALSGKVYVAAPLPVRSYVSVRGVGGASGAQFLIGSYCRLMSDGSVPADVPLISVTGSSSHLLSGLWVNRTDGACVAFDRAADVRAEFCRFDVWAPGEAPAAIIRDSFWLWFEHCAFGNQANGSTITTPSVLIENKPDDPWAPGLIEFRDVRFNAGGVELRHQAATGGWQEYGNLRFDGSIFEIPRTAFLKVGEKCRLATVIFTACSLADANWYRDAIDNPFVLNLGAIGQLIARDQRDWHDSTTFVAGNAPAFVEFDQAARPKVVVSNAPLASRRERIDGAYDMVLANRGIAEPVVTSAAKCLPISKEWTSWTKDSPLLEVGGGERDPRGQSSAAYVRLVDAAAPSLTALRFYHNTGSPPWEDGEWLVFGFWARNLSANPRKDELMIISHGDAGWTVDGVSYVTQPKLDSMAAREWRPVVRTVRLQRARPDAWDNPLLSFILRLHKGSELHVWRPFGLRLPADMPEYEVARIGASFTRHASDIAVGHAGTEEDVTFKTGRGSVRPDAALVGDGAQWFDTALGRPIWSHGGVWVTACGAIAP